VKLRPAAYGAGAIVLVGGFVALTIAYRDYSLRRAQISEVIMHGTTWRAAVEKHYQQTKKLPSRPGEMRSPPPAASENSKADLTENGVIVLTMSNTMGSAADKTVVLRPTAKGDSVTWDCTGGTLPAKFRPARCRGD
jgi:type IV pilus assembly protein PilA